MQIRVKCGCGGECQEWTIVEVQGVLEVQPAFKEQFQKLEIGQLCRPSLQEAYTFTVGYHELTGSKVPLKKPLIILKKVENDASDQETVTTHKKVELEVVGIIRQRILFKTRPKALISKPQVAEREKKVVPNTLLPPPTEQPGPGHSSSDLEQVQVQQWWYNHNLQFE